MQIGTCIYLENLGTMEERIRLLHDNHFSQVQLLAWEPELWTDEVQRFLTALLEKYGIAITAFWCGWEGPRVWNFVEGQETLGLVPQKYREMRIKNLCDGADFAKSLGVKDVVTHMGFIPENPLDPIFLPFCDAVRTVALHLKANGQNLLFESGQETPVTMLRCFETVGTDNLYVNLDTANLILYGKANPVDALDVIGTKVRGIHAKDGRYPTNGHELGEETKIGEGRVDFAAFFERLHDLGVDCPVTIEREISGDEQLRDILASRTVLQKMIDTVYGGKQHA